MFRYQRESEKKASSTIAYWLGDPNGHGTLTEVSLILRSFLRHTGRKANRVHHIPGRLCNRRLSLKQALYPTPEPSHLTSAFTIKRIIVCASALFLVSAASHDLLWRPPFGPYYFAPTYEVVRLARLLPVPYGRAQTRSAARFVNSPLGWAQRGPDLGAASAGAKSAAIPNSSE